MVLGSQQPRDSMSRSYMMTRRRRGKRWPLIAIVVLAVVAAIWMFTWTGSGDAPADGNGQGNNTALANGGTNTNTNTNTNTTTNTGTRDAPRPVGDTRYQMPRIGDGQSGNNATGNNSTGNNSTGNNATGTRNTAEGSGSQGTAAPGRATPPRFVAPPTGDPDAFTDAIRQGMGLIERGDYVAGRAALSQLLVAAGDRLRARDAQAIRDTLASINQRLIFSKESAPNDPLTRQYTVKSGDLLLKVAPRYSIPYPLIELVNDVAANRIRVGQSLKMIKGPFHAVVDCSDFRMDLFLEGPDGQPVYIRSFPVGLGEQGSTPIGNWVVRKGGKISNPAWTNPRTGKFYAADHPDNPLGQYWIALDGIDAATSELKGYGIHGTIEPDTIGTEASMGCVRLADADIELVYKLLVGGESRVQIVR